MCISNEAAKQILSNIRSIEDGEKLTIDQLTQFLADLKILQENVEMAEKTAKKALLKKGFKGIKYFPEISKKVLLSDGRTSTTYPVEDSLRALKNIGREEAFLQVVKVQQGLIDSLGDTEVNSILLTVSKTEISEAYISVGKMTKEELVEQRV